MPPKPDILGSRPTSPSTYKLTDRVPTEFLLEADGDLATAAALAGCSKADFYRSLGSDSSIADVSKAISFLALTNSLQTMNLAKEHIERRLAEAYLPDDDPDDDEMDDPDSLPNRPLSNVALKDVIALYKFSADFISQTAQIHANLKAAGRYTPPTRIPGSRSSVLQASRGIPSAASNGPVTPMDDTPPEAEPDNIEAALRDAIAANPELRDMLERAITNDPPAPYADDREGDTSYLDED